MLTTPGHIPAPPAAARHAVPEPAPAPADHTYTVQAGDTLWSIAQRFYGNPFKWPDIYQANQSQISDPNVISIGQTLTIPGSGTAGAAANAASATPARAGDPPRATTAQAGDPPSPAPAHGGGQYHNPIGPGLTPGRVDMGVDYGGAGPVYALGAGTITSIYNSGWPGGGFIGLQLSDGSGRYVYYAEDISPAVQVGQTVTAGQLIGHATGGGIEVGWAAPPGTGQTMAAATGQNQAGLAQGDPGYYPTGYGVNFSNLIRSLGGPAGIIGGPVQGAQPAAAPAQTGGQQGGGQQGGGQQGGGTQDNSQQDGSQQDGGTQDGGQQGGGQQGGGTQATQASPPAQSSLPGVPATAAYYIRQAARATGIAAKVVAAQNYVESSYGQDMGPSVTGAEGPWQFEPYTWGSYSPAPFSMANNWSASTSAYINLMKQLLQWSGGNVRQALAAYNGGQGNWQAGLGYADQILSDAGQ
jgi:LysM repeat protein